jgi:molecular chaperone GrpE
VSAAEDGHPEERDKPIIRDRRKVDPVTGKARKPEPAAAPTPAPVIPAPVIPGNVIPDNVIPDHDPGNVIPDPDPGPAIGGQDLTAARTEVAALTEDLQRLQAEFANYRKRVERERAGAVEVGRAEVLAGLIGVLDDVDAARGAGEFGGPFAAVAEKLESTVGRFGLERYGQAGEAFDPRVHEALMHEVSEDVDGPTISLVLQPGYRMGERVLRAARVGVQDVG